MLKTGMTFLLALMLATPALAQNGPQPIKAPLNKPYRHSFSKLVLPPVLGGLPRESITAFVPETPDLDMATEYRSADGSEDITVYVSRVASGAMPIWFDQARHAIESRSNVYGTVLPLEAPVSFIPPGRANAAGLAIAFSPGIAWKSTALAMAPLGEWMVKIRYSSKTLDAAAMRTRIEQLFGELGWPAKLDPAPDAALTKVCADPILFDDKAKDAPQDGASVLLNSLFTQVGSDIAKKDKDAQPVTWCVDPGWQMKGRIYRPNGAKDQYLVTIDDGGIAVTVSPDFQLPGDDKGKPATPAWGVHLVLLDRTINYRSQDGLPGPGRLNALLAGQGVSSVTTLGKKTNVTVGSDAIN